MVFIFLGLAGIASTIFSVAFITWIVALIINKKDLIKRAWKFTWISFIVAVGVGTIAALGVYSSSNHSNSGDADTEQVDDSTEDAANYLEEQEDKYLDD